MCHQAVILNEVIDKPSWRADTDAQDFAMYDALHSAEQKDKRLDDEHADYVNGFRYPTSDADMEKYNVDYENSVDPLTQLRELQSDMFKLRGGWSQRLSDVYWERVRRIHDVAQRNEHVLKITGFPFALMGGLQHSAYYLHPYEPMANERVEPLMMIDDANRAKLIGHINQVCDFRRRMIMALSRN